MAIEPGTYNIRVYRGADWSVKLTFKDSSDAVMSLVGYTVDGQIWNEARTKKFADIGVSFGTNDRANGIANLALTDTQTNLLPDLAYYDLRLTDPSSISEYYLRGTVTGLQGYTQ